MNTKLNSTKILCYGDSNTWGYIPGTKERYPSNVRWTGLLQEALGENYYLIEEGLNSRTTVLDDPKNPGKNGLTYLIPCLETHNPLDKIILFLGTNDLKEKFDRTPEQIGEGIKILIETIQQYAKNSQKQIPEIILISPTIVDESVEGVIEKYKGAEEKSQKLGSIYKNIAEKYNFKFLDLAQIIKPSKKDGYHLDPESHKIIAEELQRLIMT